MTHRLILVALAVMLSACGGTSGSSTTAAPPATTQLPPATTTAPANPGSTTSVATTTMPAPTGLAFHPGALDAGTYGTRSFLVPFTVDLPSGWQSSGENPLMIGFAFGHEVMGALGEGADPAAIFFFGRLNDRIVGDALQEVMSTSYNLEWSEPLEVELAGFRGLEVEGVNQGASYSLPTLLGSSQAYAAAGEGRVARLTALDINGTTLFVLAEAQPEEFDQLIEQRDELLGLITFLG